MGYKTLVAVVLMMVMWTTTAEAKPMEPITGAAIDSLFLKPHHSEITGQMLLNAQRYYGVPARAMLTVMGAETSMGDPHLGGAGMVGAHNYGCMRAYGLWSKTKWGELASGTIWLSGRNWLAFPSPVIGVNAMGRLMKVGPTHKPGEYKACLISVPPDWERFARTWYGADVAGCVQYIANLNVIYKRLGVKAEGAGYSW